MTQILHLNNVCKTYFLGEEKVSAVRNANIRINKGDFIAIMGPSGSGKSTLMNLVGVLDIPTEGEIFLEQHNIAKLSESDLAQIRGRKIGFIFQQFNLIRTLTAKENVMLPMMFQNIPSEEREKRALMLLEQIGLKDRSNHRPGELSGGQQQRVAIARALANNPDMILADEPTGNLDSKTGHEIILLLKNLNKKGKTIIMVTHDINVAKEAKKIIHIVDGEIK
ncbi:MAG: ABC transporter ATP-binding protein [Candidatus Pacearchaeota archaeon]|nr:ABC transporter ATP-binding protein [Candidatus Pacearchaeota archaeon]